MARLRHVAVLVALMSLHGPARALRAQGQDGAPMPPLCHCEGGTVGDNLDYFSNPGLGPATGSCSCDNPFIPFLTIDMTNCLSIWGPRLTLGHDHGSSGVAVLRVRTTMIDGPAIPAIGGGTTELLIGGPLLATFQTTHDGTTAQFSVPIPCGDLSLLGVRWAAQATVAGGGRVDLSTAIGGEIR